MFRGKGKGALPPQWGKQIISVHSGFLFLIRRSDGREDICKRVI